MKWSFLVDFRHLVYPHGVLLLPRKENESLIKREGPPTISLLLQLHGWWNEMEGKCQKSCTYTTSITQILFLSSCKNDLIPLGSAKNRMFKSWYKAVHHSLLAVIPLAMAIQGGDFKLTKPMGSACHFKSVAWTQVNRRKTSTLAVSLE